MTKHSERKHQHKLRKTPVDQKHILHLRSCVHICIIRVLIQIDTQYPIWYPTWKYTQKRFTPRTPHPPPPWPRLWKPLHAVGEAGVNPLCVDVHIGYTTLEIFQTNYNNCCTRKHVFNKSTKPCKAIPFSHGILISTGIHGYIASSIGYSPCELLPILLNIRYYILNIRYYLYITYIYYIFHFY